MEPVRILHIVHTLNYGGMESRIMDLYRNLDQGKFQYDFYVESGKQGMYDEEIKKMGGRVFYSKGVNKLNIPNFRYFRAFLREHPEYRIVYSYNQWSGSYLREAEKFGVPYRIANARTSIQTKSLKNLIKNLIKMNINRYATHRFAVSKKAADWMFGVNKTASGHVRIWPNAIDTKKFAYSTETRIEVREEIGLKDSFTVIHVGNIRFEKNHLFLLQIFSEIKKRYKDTKLVLVGGGEIETLKPRMRELSIEDDIIYLGVRKDIPRLLQAGDVFIFPSFYEGFPGAVLEAEASGLNCIISDTITDEVMLTDHIVALPLSLSPALWAERINEFKTIEREDAWKKIRDAGYDISDLSEKIQIFLNSLVLSMEAG